MIIPLRYSLFSLLPVYRRREACRIRHPVKAGQSTLPPFCTILPFLSPLKNESNQYLFGSPKDVKLYHIQNNCSSHRHNGLTLTWSYNNTNNCLYKYRPDLTKCLFFEKGYYVKIAGVMSGWKNLSAVSCFSSSNLSSVSGRN